MGFWETLTANRNVAFTELWKPYRDAAQEVGALPSYEDCLLDLPPDYTTTGLLAQAHCVQTADVATNNAWPRTPFKTTAQPLLRASRIEVDFNAEDCYRTHAGKKAKKAAKAAAQSKWAGSDNEDNKQEPSGGGDGGGGNGNDEGGGAGGAGDGEDPSGGGNNGGDDGGDDWSGNTKKSKKKKKKSPWEVSLLCFCLPGQSGIQPSSYRALVTRFAHIHAGTYETELICVGTGRGRGEAESRGSGGRSR